LLIDTSILIDHLKGRADATRFLTAMRTSVGLLTNVVVAAEVLTGARDIREQREIERLLADFQVEPIEAVDSMRSLDFLRQYRLARGIGWQDCLIAATAMRMQMPVATLNDRHFAVITGLNVHRPY
jgi:predicted nucleic acid-binding protein